MTIGKRIKQLRMRNNLSQAELGKIAGVTDKAVSTWEQDQKIPRMGAIEKMALYFGVTKSYIIDGVDDGTRDFEPTIPPGFEPLPEMQLIPLVGEIACGMPITAEENLDGYVEAPKGRHIDFALTCKGESMVDAGISDGDVVFVRKQPTVENGQIAAVRVNGEATVKRVYINGNAMILQPANINFLPQTYAISELDDVAIEGLVVGWTHWV
ncbi:MAG: LexA family protein [Acutalibacteraceae bacterium]